jgi:class 3 adenylate cyclase
MAERDDDPMKFRLDFDFVDISDDPNHPEIVSVLNPDRYEYTTTGDGEPAVIDKLDPRHLLFPLSAINDLLKRAGKLPLNDLRPKTSNTDDYILSRLDAISEGIRSGVSDNRFRNINNEEMEPTSSRHFVIISIDLVGSTILSQSVSPQDFANVIQTYSREVTLMCDLFHGRVLKYMGDGLMLFFPTGTLARKHDFAFDCALSLRDLVLVGINSVLKTSSLPMLSCRIGFDSGHAPVVSIGDGATMNNIDIIGEVVNIAAKIEKSAPTNGICVGESVAINAHTMWLKHLVRAPEPEHWPYRDSKTGKPYGIYYLDMPAETLDAKGET